MPMYMDIHEITGATAEGGFGSVPRQESPSRITWISSDRRFNLPRDSVPMLSRNRVWYRTPLPSCAWERG